MMNQDEMENKRFKWTELYSKLFEKESKFLYMSDIFQDICLIISIANIIISYVIPEKGLEVIIAYTVLFLTLGQKYFLFQANNHRKYAESGRRASFYIKLVPFSRLKCVIQEFEQLNIGVTPPDPDFYIQHPNVDQRRVHYLHFLESIYTQVHLMKEFKLKLKFKTIILIIINVSFIPVISISGMQINQHVIPVFIIIIGFSADEILKVIRFFRVFETIFIIKNNLEELADNYVNKQDWFHFESLRLQQEYSIALLEIIPIPDKFFQKRKNDIAKRVLSEVQSIKLKIV